MTFEVGQEVEWRWPPTPGSQEITGTTYIKALHITPLGHEYATVYGMRGKLFPIGALRATGNKMPEGWIAGDTD